MLASIFSSADPSAGPPVILARRPNMYTSTFPTEIVTCRFPDESERRLFCKYGAGVNSSEHGQRGGVAYEAEVYRQILQPLGVSIPRYHGSWDGKGSCGTALVFDYVEDSVRLDLAEDPESRMLRAARWLGRFHALGEAWLRAHPSRFLIHYDMAYYRAWPERTATFSRRWHEQFPGLAELRRNVSDCFLPLLQSAPVVIHGEFYPKNILVRGNSTHPVDWESAAIAAGEIDLVSLTEGWPAELAREFELEYARSRWPGGPTASFERGLEAARLYTLVRWLDERPESATREGVRCLFEQLRAAGERSGRIEGGQADDAPRIEARGFFDDSSKESGAG